MEISWEKFQEIRNLVNLRKANHSTENSGNSRLKVNETEISRKKIFEDLGITS